MKKILSLLIIQLFALGASAQINYETEYNYSGTFVNLALSGTKFYIMDVPANQCRIYNTDHTLWKTIPLSVPANNYLYDIRFVSENLFTTDNSLALAYIYYNYDETGQYYTYTAKVIRENGSELLSIPGAQYLYVYDLGDDGVKLIAYVYDYSVSPYTVKTRIYDLPGNLLAIPSGAAPAPSGLGAPVPNPAGNFTQIHYTLPEDAKEGTIILQDVKGNAVQSYRVDRNFKSMYINTAQLPAGLYLYFLKTGQYTSPARKLVVEK